MLQLTTQGVPSRIDDTNCMLNLKFFYYGIGGSVILLFSGFFYDFPLNFFLFTVEKKVSSTCLDVALVHQCIGAPFGLCAPCLNTENDLKRGPICRV